MNTEVHTLLSLRHCELHQIMQHYLCAYRTPAAADGHRNGYELWVVHYYQVCSPFLPLPGLQLHGEPSVLPGAARAT